MQGRRPNIVFVQSDSMDGRVMGCARHAAARTPNMDRLASQGVLFQNAYCNSPQCCPSRASMWSGKHVFAAEAWNNHKGLSPEEPTFQTRLDQAGYRTHIIGRTDHLSGRHSLKVRLNAWLRDVNILAPQRAGPGVRVDEAGGRRFSQLDWDRVDEAVTWLADPPNQDSRPFFLSVGFNQPHPAFVISRPWLEEIDAAAVTVPPRDESTHPVMEFMRVTKGCGRDFSEEEALLIRRIYYAMVAEVDAMVGALMQAVEDAGLADSTHFIYTSDHGEMTMEHGQHLKNSLYESSVRVPLIVRGPGVARGAAVEHPVSLVDMFPTFMDMAEAPHPEGLHGTSLMPELAGRSSDRPDWVLSEYHSNFQNTGSFMLRSGDWKYVAYVGYEPQLFHLRDDLDEVRNLAAARPGVLDAMDRKLRRIVDYEAVDARAKAYDKESFRAWRASVSDEDYAAAMTTAIEGWNPEHDARIRAWLDGA